MASDQPAPTGEHDDDLHRHFREALERKKAARTAPGTAAEAGGKRLGPGDNTKRQRQFRRKSG